MNRALEVGLVALLVVAMYSGLRAELPVDDVLGHRADIAAGRFRWQAAHLFMQPAGVVWHRFLGFGSTPHDSQRNVSLAAATIGLALFMDLLQRLAVGAAPRWLAVLVAMSSYSFVHLGTSGHMKLLALPPLTAALSLAAIWETRRQEPPYRRRDAWLWASAACLGLATLCLANSIVVAPFVAGAILLHSRDKSAPGRLLLAATYVGIAAGLAASGLLVAYLAAVDGPHSIGGWLDFLLEKSRHRHNPMFSQLPIRLARGAYAVVLNFVDTGQLGPVARARLSGQLDRLAGYGGELARGAIPFLLTSLALAAVYRAGWRRGAAPRLMAWSFWGGCVCFGLYWNLSEAEFYFQTTLPTLLLASTTTPAGPNNRWLSRNRVLATLLIVAFVANIGLWAWPRKQYPFSAHAAQWRSTTTASDLIVCFHAYGGKPSMGLFLFDLTDRHVYGMDARLRVLGRKEEMLGEARGVIDETLARNGRVTVVGVLEERDWNAPWPILARFQLSKRELQQFFADHWRVSRLPDQAGLPCWQLTEINTAATS